MPQAQWINSDIILRLTDQQKSAAYIACSRHEVLEHGRAQVEYAQTSFDSSVAVALDTGIKRGDIAELLGLSGAAITQAAKRVRGSDDDEEPSS